VTHPQMDLPADYLPPGHDSTFPHHSSYGATKLQAEQSALRRHMPGRLGVCALRMPMIFGIDDPLVVAPLLSGALDRVPDMPGPPLVEFCYVENAAAAHVAALAALIGEEEEKEEEVATSSCRPRVGGRAFNVTNGDAPQSAFALWDALARKAAIRQRELGCPPPHLKPLRRLPFGLLLGLACASEFVFALCCGHVPRRRATFWNLTRASLRLSCTTVTQSLAETQRDLGWTPEFTTLQAFDHMLRGWRPGRADISDPLTATSAEPPAKLPAASAELPAASAELPAASAELPAASSPPPMSGHACSHCTTISHAPIRCPCHGAWYCGVACQRAHWSAHKLPHQHLVDRKLLGLPPADDVELQDQLNPDCPVCMQPMPANNRKGSFRTCCGQALCADCDARAISAAGDMAMRCPFCREPGARTGADTFARLNKLVARNPENERALSHLADCYRMGDGVARDMDEARCLYEKASALGDAGAAVGLGEMYAQGNGVTADLDESRRYFELAISRGSIVAIHNFGISRVLAGYHAEAKSLFIRAAARGYEDSTRSLQIMRMQNQGVSEAEVAAANRACARATAESAAGLLISR
jgi:nucleoside-diphosphate-sugar epimerase